MERQLFELGVVVAAGSALAVTQGANGLVGQAPRVTAPVVEAPAPVVRTVVLRAAPSGGWSLKRGCA